MMIVTSPTARRAPAAGCRAPGWPGRDTGPATSSSTAASHSWDSWPPTSSSWPITSTSFAITSWATLSWARLAAAPSWATGGPSSWARAALAPARAAPQLPGPSWSWPAVRGSSTRWTQPGGSTTSRYIPLSSVHSQHRRL